MIIITGIYFKKRNVYDFHHAILGELMFFLFCFVLLVYTFCNFLSET